MSINDSSINYPEVHQTSEVSTFGNPRSVLHWTLNLLILTIPFVNFAFLILWALGTIGAGEIKKNFSIAFLLIYGIIIALSLVLYIIALIIIVAASGTS